MNPRGDKAYTSRSGEWVWMHLRIPYYRPSWQGGDTAHPLCMVPVAGWRGERALDCLMTDDKTLVDCAHCLRNLAAGGLSARIERLTRNLRDDDRRDRAARAREAA